MLPSRRLRLPLALGLLGRSSHTHAYRYAYVHVHLRSHVHLLRGRDGSQLRHGRRGFAATSAALDHHATATDATDATADNATADADDERQLMQRLQRLQRHPVLFVIGGPGAGKGSMCSLLMQEFGTPIRAVSDAPVLPPDVPERMLLAYPPLSRSSIAPPHLDDAPPPSSSSSSSSPHYAPLSRPFVPVHISIGALLRHEMSARRSGAASVWSRTIKQAIDSGVILPGHITVHLLAQEMLRIVALFERLPPPITSQPFFLIDGFPRILNNVEEFEKVLGSIRHMLFLDCPDDVLVHRLTCRSKSSGRSDDTTSIIRKRISTYHEHTQPVIRAFAERTRPLVSSAHAPTSPSQSATLPAPSTSPAWSTHTLLQTDRDCVDASTRLVFARVDSSGTFDAVYARVRQAFLAFTHAFSVDPGSSSSSHAPAANDRQ